MEEKVEGRVVVFSFVWLLDVGFSARQMTKMARWFLI
jgi:hypothetical protein